jgi:ABC-type lipoprotein release transport system permease subunit
LRLLLKDILYSARGFARAPGLSSALLISIALGVGGNAVIQGFVRGLMPVPKYASDDVVSIFRNDSSRRDAPVSYEDLQRIRPSDLEWLGIARVEQRAAKVGKRSAVLAVAAVSPEVASLLQLSFKGGALAGLPVNQGETVQIGDEQFVAAGVAPEEGIYRDLPVDLWIPLDRNAVDTNKRNLWAVAKLRPGASIPSELHVAPFTGMLPDQARGLANVATVLRAAAFSIFFTACANVAAFLLGRATIRSKETSLRVALGASRWDLARGVLSDSIVTSVAGGMLGALLAVWMTKIIPALLFEEDAQRLVFVPDFWSITLISVVCVAITIACGMLPLIATSYDRPYEVLRRESAGPSRIVRALRSAMVISQMACCCLLVVSTGFLVQGLRAALKTTVSRTLGAPVLASVQTGERYEFFENIEQEARAMHGVTPLAWANRLPGNRPDWRSYRIEPQGVADHEVRLDLAAFSFHTQQMKAGRLFGFADRGCRVAVLNDSAAAVLYGEESIGRSVRDPAGRRVDIIGVVMDSRRPTIYFNHSDPLIPMARFRASKPSVLASGELDTQIVSPSYFDAMGLSLIAGRPFQNQPRRYGCRVGIVNQQAADSYFGGSAVGASVIDESGSRTEIIGVVHSPPLGTFQRGVEPAIYLPMAQDFVPRMTLIFSAKEVNDELLADARRRFDAMPGRGPLPSTVKTMDTHLSQTSLAPLRVATAIVTASAACALLLGVLGLYVALDDAARRRNREIAVRIALGARRRDLIAQVLGDGVMLATIGVAIGLLGAVLLGQLLVRILPPGDPAPLWVWLVGPAMLAGAVGVSAVLPARRASLVDPLRIMRDSG